MKFKTCGHEVTLGIDAAGESWCEFCEPRQWRYVFFPAEARERIGGYDRDEPLDRGTYWDRTEWSY